MNTWQSHPLATLQVNRDGRVTAANEAAHTFFTPLGALLGINLFHLFPELSEMVRKAQAQKTPVIERLLPLHWDDKSPAGALECLVVGISDDSAGDDDSEGNEGNEGNEGGHTLIFIPLTHWLAMARTDGQRQEAIVQRAALREWAHEVNNPLGGMLAAVQWWQKSMAPQLPPSVAEDTAPLMGMLLAEINRLRTLTAHLLSKKEVAHGAINVHKILEPATQVFAHEFSEVNVVRDYDVSLPDIVVHSEGLHQAVMNLLRNAGQAMRRAKSPHPTIFLRTRLTHRQFFHAEEQDEGHSRAPGDEKNTAGPAPVPVPVPVRRSPPLAVALDIEDNGPGMPTEGTPVSGHGLGISIARRLISEARGDMMITSRPGMTRWRLILPCAP